MFYVYSAFLYMYVLLQRGYK